MKQLLTIPVLIIIINLSFGQKVAEKGNGLPYALIAGGSKGIGYSIAEALAKRNYNLILIARHLDSLIIARDRLEATYPIQVDIIAVDLAEKESAGNIAKWCKDNNIPVKVLCNVAGFGGSRDYLSGIPLDSLRYMVNVNVESCMALTYEMLPVLEKNAPAYILNVASMAGFAPIPSKNIYSATKAFVIYFSYSLRYELEDKNISVSCLAPGPVFTKPAVVQDTKEKLGGFGMMMAVSPKKVGEAAVKKTFNKKMIITPGILASISATMIRVLPRRFVVGMYSGLSKNKKH